MAFVADKQLGGVLKYTDIVSSAQVGTAQQIAESRAIIFAQFTAAVVVTIPNPIPATPKMLTIVNRGDVPITIMGMVVQPGPAYGLYFDGNAFIPATIEGVGTVSNLLDSSTLAFGGDGSDIAPLYADVKISAKTGNGISVENDGLFYSFTDIAAGVTSYVDAVGGDDTNSGTIRAPLKTVQAAVNKNSTLVLVYPGTYNENVLVNNGATIQGFGVFDGQIVKIKGNVRTGNAGIPPKFKDVILEGQTSGTPTVEFDTTLAEVNWDNVSIQHKGGASETVINFKGNNNGFFSFHGGSIKGKINVADSAQVSPLSIYIDGGAESPVIQLNNSHVSVIVSNKLSVGPIVHTEGNLLLKAVGIVTKGSDGNSIVSTAVTGLLSLHDTGFMQLDGSFGAISKSGAGPYVIGDIKSNPANDTFAGTRIYVENAVHIHANYSAPSAYTPADPSLVGHLKGINDALANTVGGLKVVTTTDTATLDISGGGTTLDPLQAAVKTSSATGNTLQLMPDGLFVPASATGLQEVTHQDSDVVSLSGDGSPTDPLIADVILSPNSRNLITRDLANGGGLIVVEKVKNVELGFSISYNWLANETLFAYAITEDFQLPQGLAGTVLRIDQGTFTNVQQVLTLNKNGVAIGTVTIAINNTVTFQFANAVNFTAGDLLTLVSASQAQFNYVAITLFGQRPLSGA